VLHVTKKELGNSVVLHCRGRIVRGHETAIVCAAVIHSGRNVILDLSEIEAIDAAGIGALVSLQAAGIYLHLANPAKPILELLRVTHLDSIFEIDSAPLNHIPKPDSAEETNATPRLDSPLVPFAI